MPLATAAEVLTKDDVSFVVEFGKRLPPGAEGAKGHVQVGSPGLERPEREVRPSPHRPLGVVWREAL